MTRCMEILKIASSLQSKILEYLASVPECKAYKIITANERGCPDIIGVHRGRGFFIEVKEEGDTTSPIQQAQIELIKRAGGLAFVARSLEHVKRLIN